MQGWLVNPWSAGKSPQSRDAGRQEGMAVESWREGSYLREGGWGGGGG